MAQTAAPDAAGRTKREQVRSRLLQLHGELDHGTAIPPERELAATLGVSRPTLRAAVDDLVAEGYFDRRQGSGTFIGRPGASPPMTLISFSEDMRRRGMEPGGSILGLREVAAGAKLGFRLALSPRERVWEIRRLRSADGLPMAVEVAWVPAHLVPGLDEASLAGRSLYSLLAEAGHRVDHALQEIAPTVTTDEESALLGVPELSPALLFERITRNAHGTTIEVTRSVFRGDRYRVLAELRPPQR